jgi:peptidoglycan-N-acetylglucosamine deacetylase
MDDGKSAIGERPPTHAQSNAAPGRGGPGPSSRHRRRRATALALVGLVALVVGVAVGAMSGGGGGGSSRARVGATPGAYLNRVRVLAGSGPGSFAVAEQAAENQAINRTLAYTPYVRIAGSQHREVALTFDDGPGPYTPAIVSELTKLHVPATFFEVGVLERYFHDATAEIVARGFPIGDHTESHAPMSELPRKVQLSQLLEQTAAIGSYGAPFPRLFRPPYGLWNATTLSLLKRYRMLMVLWSVDTSDYQMPGVSVIVKRALDGAEPGAIILLHDAGGNRTQTIAALPGIVRGLRKRGYKLVTVPRLLLDNPAPKDQNVAALAGSAGG